MDDAITADAPPVIIVEDDPSLRDLLQEELELEGYRVQVADSRAGFEALVREQSPQLVISDLRLPDGNGLELLALSRRLNPDVLFLVITAFGTVDQAVAALKAGADEFFTKPLSIDHLLLTLRRLLHHRATSAALSRYRDLLGQGSFHGLLGHSAIMQELYSAVGQIAGSEAPVLILGESGVGKELVARAIHQESPRASGPFVAVNCAGIPQELLEAEFFGHAAGAFTGARKARRGLFGEAHGGTLLLDEVAEMPMLLQAKLLRALQEGCIRPVGADREEPVDVRVLAATHRDLSARVAAGEFREDLFYRLEALALHIPPLREREDDSLFLAEHFLAQSSARQGKGAISLAPETRELLARYPFPGNVRELANALERAVTFCNGDLIQPGHLPRRMTEALPDMAPCQPREGEDADTLEDLPTLEQVQQRYVARVMARVDGNKQQAARVLGINRRTLYRWLDTDRDT